jgi:hypothetical protein
VGVLAGRPLSTLLPPPTKEPPMSQIFLNKADVLNFSATRLEGMANDLRVALAVVDLIKVDYITGDDKAAKALEEIKAVKDCPVDQIQILLTVASDLRRQALEEFALSCKTKEIV